MYELEKPILLFKYYAAARYKSDAFSALVKAHFEGASNDVYNHLVASDDSSSPPFPNLRQTPVYPYFRSLVAQQLGREQEAARSTAEVVNLRGNVNQCANDVFAFLSEGGRPDMALGLLEQLGDDAPNEPGILLNLFAIALATNDAACQRRGAAGFATAAETYLRTISTLGNLKATTFALFCELLRMFIATGLRYLERSEFDETQTDKEGRAIADFIVILIANLDSHPVWQRDSFVIMILENFFLDDANALQRRLAATPKGSLTEEILSACLDHALCVSGAEESLAKAAERDEGISALTGLALVHGEKGDLDQEYACVDRIIERTPSYSRGYFHAASNRFRAGDLARANELAERSIEFTAEKHLSGMREAANESGALLERAIAEHLPERTKEIDPFQDDEYMDEWWYNYKHQFETYTYRQDYSVFLNELYLKKIFKLIEEDSIVKCIINFGTFCGHFDRILADQAKDKFVFGFDRDERSIELNRREYAAPNLEFRSGEFDSLLREARELGTVVVAHIRTLTMLYPEGVRRFFELCYREGVSYILGIEATGYSFQLGGFPDFEDPDRMPVVPFGIMVDHNYPQLLADAGYETISCERMVYPIIAPLRVNQEMMVPMCYVAKRSSSRLETARVHETST